MFGMSLPEIVLDSVEKGQVPLFKFKTFNESPKVLSLDEFRKSLIIPGILFPAWDSTSQYKESDRVTYKGKNYECYSDNLNTAPGINSDVWQVTRVGDPTIKGYFGFTTLGLDYVVEPGHPAKLQFVHFYYSDYSEGGEYMVSIEARKVVEVLNNSGVLLFSKLGFMNHLVGDVFLLNEYDDKISLDLKGKIDTSKTKVSDDRYNILTRFNKGRIEQFFLFENGTELLDTIPQFDLNRLTAGSNSTFSLIGDAFLDSKNLKFMENQKQTKLKVLKTRPQQASASNRPISTIGCQVHEAFYLNKEFHKKIYEPKFFSSLNKLLNTVYQGVSDSKLKVYLTDSLNSYYTLKEIIERWTKEPNPTYPEWDAEGYYASGDRVIHNAREYLAIGDNTNLPPATNPKVWRGRNTAFKIFQPADITSFNFTYQLTFDSGGAIIKQQPVSIQFFAYHDDSGTFRPLGHFEYQELLEYASNQNPEMNQFLKNWIENQTGLFMVQGYGPLKSLENEKH